MREAAVERRLSEKVKRAGGMSIKLAPTVAGLPDRLIILPGGELHFVELKAVGGRLRPIQEHFHHRLAELGVPVAVLTGPDEVDDWIKETT